MARMARFSASLCVLAALAVVRPAAAQDFQASVEKARATLTEMARLLDGIEARKAAPRAADAEGWKSLFDGATLAGWKRTDFYSGGAVRVERSFRGGPPAIVIDAGATLSGITWIGEAPPKTNFEIALEFLKIKGDDFGCGLTFPVGDSHATLILGGWGGKLVGISSIEGADASENTTTRFMDFPPDRWFRVRMRVTAGRLEAWLDDQKIVDQDIQGRRISLRPGAISLSVPLGIATYQTSAAFRDIRLRAIPGR